MFDDHAGLMELDVYRGFSPLPELIDDEGWTLGPQDGIEDAFAVCSPRNVAWLVHGVAKLEDVRDINAVEGWVSIDREEVRVVELLPLDEQMGVRLAEELRSAIEELSEREAELQELRDAVDELRRDEEDGDEDEA